MSLGLPALVWFQTASLGGGVPLHTKKKKLRKNSLGWSLKEASPPGRVQHLCLFSNQTLSIAFTPAFA
jgi:hypothetical protein